MTTCAASRPCGGARPAGAAAPQARRRAAFGESRGPATVGDGAQDLTAPAHRREQRRKKAKQMMSRTAPTNPAERAAQLRQELEKCDRFMRATDAVVRRTQERTLAISTRLVAADHATAFAVPIAEPLPKTPCEEGRAPSMKK